jgi:sigma-B regulation protein RsbU (phosphoserine phosphatase)
MQAFMWNSLAVLNWLCTQLVERFSNDLIGVPLTIVSPKQPVPTFRQFRLRTTLVVPFVLQIAAAVGLVGYLSLGSSQKAVNDLATQLRRELTARIEGELRRYLASPHDFNRLNEAAFSEGSFDMVNASNAKQFLTQVQISPFVYSSYCGDYRGYYLGAYRLSERGSSTIAMSVSNAETNYNFYFYAMDSRGNRRDLLQKLKPYDPRKRSWYIAAAKAKRSIWSEVYLDFASGLPTITASEPVYDSTGKILGVCATDVVLLEDLRKFLASLPIGQTGQAFIIDRSGSMISSSTKEPLTVGKGEDSKLIVATESSEPLIKTTARHLQQQFGSFDKIQRSQQLDYLFEGERQFVQVLPLNDGRGIDWLITVVVPESDYMGQIYANTRNTFLLTLAALILAIVIGILTARRLTRPILQIAKASQDMAVGHLDQNVESSRIIELEELANSFNRMAGQLQESFGALRQSEATNRAIVTAIPDLLIRAKGDGSYLEIARLDIAGYMEPADEVGGDYYDVLHTDDIVTIGIGDVTGHGLESGILMLMVQTAVRTLQEVRERDPVRFLDTLNRTIYKNVQRMNSERNLTLAVLNYAEGAVSISGQHEETIVVRKGGQIERIDTMDLGFPIGIDDNIADFISHAIVELQPGDGVVVYTDGIPEAKNIDKKQYGIEPLCEVISHHWHKSASEIKEAIITDLRQFIGKQKVFDDITLLVFKRQDGASEDKYNHEAIASSDESVHSARESMPVVSTIATGEPELTYDKTQEIL